MLPKLTVAASLVPSHEEVMASQPFGAPTDVSSVQVAPESVEVHMFPNLTVAASLVPSLEEVMPYKPFGASVDVISVQVAPESVEVQRFPSPPERSLRRPI